MPTDYPFASVRLQLDGQPHSTFSTPSAPVLTMILIMYKFLPMKITHATIAASAALALALTGCSTDASGSTDTTGSTPEETLSVMTQLYAMTYLAEAVGGDHITATQLIPAGADAHTFELSPKQVSDLSNADVALITSGNTDAIDQALEDGAPEYVVDMAQIMTLIDTPTKVSVDDVEAAEEDHEEAGHDHEEAGHDHGDTDPHTWLNIAEMPLVIDALEQAFAVADPDNADDYAANAAALRAEFETLDADYRDGLSQCATSTFVVTHPAFGYVSNTYGLTQVGISGLDEDTEPSPARLRGIQEVIQAVGTDTIFFANNSSPSVAETLAGELDLHVGVLSTLTSAEDGEDYLSIARDNLEALTGSLSCS